uniref:protein SOB FIVE-LIKE 3-like n=1 Tax=Erigeron canadensis TaxID=72917 RepID=UPI001CB956F4|nr:protein SOB FIVE-LIKE 3-like [Erigeron canadensis]
MEFSKYLGAAAEECSSSESGWTMYIVSPMHETNYNNNHHYYHDQHVINDGIDKSQHNGDYDKMYHNHEDSDDSMVSDASSRPSRQPNLCGMSKKPVGGLRRDHFKHALNQKHAEKKLYDRRQRAMKEDGCKTRIDVVKARKTN